MRAFAIYKSLSMSIQTDLLSADDFLATSRDNDQRSLLLRYLLAATVKDCSVMITMRLVQKQNNNDDDDEDVVHLTDDTAFTFNVRVVDLDPKSPKNLLSSYQRFVDGVRIIEEVNDGTNRLIHRPCF